MQLQLDEAKRRFLLGHVNTQLEIARGKGASEKKLVQLFELQADLKSIKVPVTRKSKVKDEN